MQHNNFETENPGSMNAIDYYNRALAYIEQGKFDIAIKN